MKMNNAINDLINISQYAGNRVDYTQAGGGNTSVKVDHQTMIIKASGYRLKDITESQGFVTVKYRTIQKFIQSIKDVHDRELDEKNKSILAKSIITFDGKATLRPSVETGFHSILDKYVIHTHSVYSNLINCSEDGINLLKTIFKYADFSYISIPYINPGLELSVVMSHAIQEYQTQHSHKPEVIFLVNHGLIVTANDIERVKYLHTEVNERIRIFFGLDEVQPHATLLQVGDMKYQSTTPFILNSLKELQFSIDLLKKYPLYPDQLVFLNNVLDMEPQKVLVTAHEIIYQTDLKEADIMNESLFAFLFVVITLMKNHIDITTMNEQDIAFINGWEAEKYRKKLAQKEENK
jgi:rhamnose utilization protein RhaD (predicted bifunctional aldolase and dehydrogenase)